MLKLQGQEVEKNTLLTVFFLAISVHINKLRGNKSKRSVGRAHNQIQLTFDCIQITN